MNNVDNNTHDKIERQLDDIDWAAYQNRRFTPSPPAWEDQVLYFLMLDRFSDNQERDYKDINEQPVNTGSTPLFQFEQDAYKADRQQWAAQGNRWLGGNLKGLTSKIGYLKRLGIGAVWISPVFKQVPADTYSYHGYGIQNFLDVDPHFGSRQDLKELVDTAHAHGIYVILDIIFNHSGDVFDYDADRYLSDDDNGGQFMDPRWDGQHYNVKGYRDAGGSPDIPFQTLNKHEHPDAWPDQAVWPGEMQDASSFTRKGRISSWDYDPEYLQGDFITLKDIHHGRHELDHNGNRIVDVFYPSPALMTLCEVYKFWIAFADIDGFRIDTVKHMEPGATRFFSSVVHEYAQSVGKENFYLIGEITGGRQNAFELMETTGLNAALGINDIPDRIEYLSKGYREPQAYFNLFRNSVLLRKGSHVWYGSHVITLFDDHDQVRKGDNKARFCGDKQNNSYNHLPGALALNLTTIGIPCLYYGTEQAFDGAGGNDRFLRECMFGGQFGSLQSSNRHFFNEQHEIYRFISEVIAIKKQRIALRRGRQYLRQISDSGQSGSFAYPHMINGQIYSVIPWSRIFNNHEIVLAINTDAKQSRTVWVTIDNYLHNSNAPLHCIYSTDSAQLDDQAEVRAYNGRAVLLTVPAGGFVIYE